MIITYTPAYSVVTGFKAVPYWDGVLLSWNAGLGEPTSTSQDVCWVSIQYAEYDTAIERPVFGYPITPNTPPYVVRDYIGRQGTSNQIFHTNGSRGKVYFYSLFIFYGGSTWYGPFNTTTVILPTNTATIWTNGIVSFSKLGVNTRLDAAHKIPKTQVIVWNPLHDVDREAYITAAIKQIKPAHVDVDVLFEHYYAAHTTDEQLAACTYESDVYSVIDGAIVNIAPTIDSSFSGTSTLTYGADTPISIGYDLEQSNF